MPRPLSLLSLRLAPFLLFAAAATAQIEWSTSLDTALARAAAENTIVMIAINMPGERASDAIDADHYKDKHLAELAGNTVNLLFRVGPNGSSHPDEVKVRTRYLKVDPQAPVAVPHHLFVKPGGDGELLSSVAYALTKGQLEWIWVDAIRKVKPDFAWTFSDAARAPEALRFGAADKGETDEEPPTKAEVEGALDELKRSRHMGGMGMLRNYGVILRSDEPEGMKYVANTMRSIPRGEMKQRTLREIGEVSPEPWWTVASPYLEDRSEKIREEAVRALEKLVAEKSLNDLKKIWKSEGDDVVRGRVLRALAAVAPRDKTVSASIGKTLAKDKVPAVRVQAAVAASVLEIPEDARAHLTAGLGDGDGKVRAAAAYGAAARRDAEMVPALEAAAKAEKDSEAAHWLALAIAVIKGGDLREFDRFAEKVVGDRRGRQKLDLEGLFGGGGRGEDGGDRGNGGGDRGNGGGDRGNGGGGDGRPR